MSRKEIAAQVLLEHELLGHITAALRVTLDWKYRGSESSRKVSSLLFIAQSFRRHVERLFDFDDDPEFVSVLLDIHPHLRGRVEALRDRHATFRTELAETVEALEQARVADAINFGNLCEDLRDLMGSVEEYSQHEMALLERYVSG